GDQVGSVALSRIDFGFQGYERTIQRSGGAASVGAQVSVARGKRQAVRFPHDGAHYDLGVEVQVGGHLLDDAALLGVFAAEVSEAGLHDFEKLQNYRGDTLKMSRAGASFESIAEALDIHQRAKALRIDFFGGRRE